MKINMNTTTKKALILAASAVLALGMFCSCGGSSSSEDEATEAATKATVTAGEAAEEAQENADQATTATRKKTGTEDPAIDSAKAAAYERIEGFDGKWKNIEIDVGDTVTTIDFDWNGEHYQYTFDQTTNQITE